MLSVLCVAPSYGWKEISHFVSLPLIEGGGIYVCAKTLADAESNASKAAAVVNLGLLATNATIGTITVFLPGESRDKMRTVHRIVAFTLTAAAIGLSVANTVDDNIHDTSTRPLTYAYAGLTAVPIIVFSF
jgi:heme A synthase